MKYYNYKTVASKITNLFKNIQFDEDVIAQWCAECCMNLGQFEFFEYKASVLIPVTNHMAEVPCDLYQLKRVYFNFCPYNAYTHDGVFIKTKIPNGEIAIDYLAIKMDSEGLPIILFQQLDACLWFCIHNLILEPFLMGKIDANKYQMVEQKYQLHYIASIGDTSLVSQDDIERVAQLARAMTHSTTFLADANAFRSSKTGRNINGQGDA
jgi:hypothetical protein